MKPPKIDIDPMYLDMFKECKPTGEPMPIKPKAKTETKKRVSIAMTPSVHKMEQAHAERLNRSLSELIETLLIEEMSNA